MRRRSPALVAIALACLVFAAASGAARADDDDQPAPPKHPKGYYEVCQHQRDGMDCFRIFQDCTKRWVARDANGATGPCAAMSYTECKNLLEIVKKRANEIAKLPDSERDEDPNFRLACRGYTIFTPDHFYVTCPMEHRHGTHLAAELADLMRSKCR